MVKKKRVVIGFLGVPYDMGQQKGRWLRWRPTVAQCQHEHFPIDRVELIHLPNGGSAAQRVRADIRAVSPSTEVRLTCMEIRDSRDFEEVYCALHDFARAYPFSADSEEYLVNITTATQVAQICWLLLIGSRDIPGDLLHLTPPLGGVYGDPGAYKVIDIDLTHYDRIAARFKPGRPGVAPILDPAAARNGASAAEGGRIERAPIPPIAPAPEPRMERL